VTLILNIQIQLVHTNSQNPDFQYLVKFLDADLASKNGDEHSFYAQFNKIDSIKHVIVAYLDSKPVGCGAIKAYSEMAMEVKRMFVLPEQRKRGVASEILNALEKWAVEIGYHSCVLETGHKQPEAIALYKKSGYEIIPNYGQYAGVENSVCFEKKLAAAMD
jgi:GNAT superfamily N-acetyltransferase